MVQLIQIDRLGPRIEGMLYKCAFEESWSLLDDVSLNSCVDVLCFMMNDTGCKKIIRGWSISPAGQAFQGASQCE
jgi:hypothetical protein